MTSRSRDRTKGEPSSALSTAVPARNFTIPLAARVQAAAGPPAYVVRKRRIEDLEEQVVEEMCEAIDATGDHAQAREALAAIVRIERRIRQLAELVVAHNRYYPVEANLPLDPKTGGVLERGKPWAPLVAPTFEALFARALHACR